MKTRIKRLINFLVMVAVITFVVACDCGGENKQEAEGSHDEHHEGAVKPAASIGNYGAIISDEEALAATELPTLLADKETVEVKLVGNVASVCQMSGCWMDVEIGDDEVVHVTFKDDGFLLPKDAAGKTAVIEGWATYEEIPVKMLKHLAEDAGKSEEEITAITEPKLEYTFVASGVILEENVY